MAKLAHPEHSCLVVHSLVLLQACSDSLFCQVEASRRRLVRVLGSYPEFGGLNLFSGSGSIQLETADRLDQFFLSRIWGVGVCGYPRLGLMGTFQEG